MALIASLIDEVARLAHAKGDSDDAENHAKLVHSIHRLQLAAEKPIETAKRIMYQPPTNIALRLAVELGLLDALVTGGRSGPVSATLLAESTQCEEILVVRIMRCLTAMGICNEDGPRTYSPNEVTKEFTSEGLKDGVKCLIRYDTVIPATAGLHGYLTAFGPRVPTHAEETPFAYIEKATMFQWMEKRPEQRRYFDSFMAARRREAPRWFEIWPVSDTLKSGLRSGPDDVLLVDIGASHGHDLMGFKERYGSFPGRLVLQDLPETTRTIHNLAEGIEAMAYDFFTPQPVAVCHDFDDDSCVIFLTGTADAMERGYSTLLIYDYVVPEVGASVRAAAMDLQMMVLVGGMERTEIQWRAILRASGLDLVRVWSLPGASESVIEAQLL
ncbi:MAG: hypothetical protein LQ339_006414 [Xanthoria mediterranea]|nr:MAG: hypothetical protein LQ339_006414 [Xanthoria mediterranea]